jgi:hypothetical protein
MKPVALALATALVIAAATPASADAPRRPPLLRGAQCLDPDFARGWVYLDDRNIVVDSGRYRYHIELNSQCRDLAWSPFIAFRGDPISGRVCGSSFDAVLTRERPCTISAMTIITKEEYKALEQHNSRKARRERRRAIPRTYD